MKTKAQSNSARNINTPVNEAPYTVLNLVDTAAVRTREVAEMLGHVPYVRTLTGVIGQVIGIRDEMKLDRECCLEIINRVLHFSVWICGQLRAIEEPREEVQKLENMRICLNDCERVLNDLLKDLKKHQQRSMFERLGSRGRDKLNALDRSVRDMLHKLQIDIISNIKAKETSNANKDSVSHQASSGGHNHILPAKPKIFVERDKQLKEARKILLQEQPSRIAILGGGGFGKTTLALWILHDNEIAKRYELPYFLSCDAMVDDKTLLLGLAEMLDIKSTSTPTILASARDILASSPTLLCLDNFETPWWPSETRPKVEDLLAKIADIPNLSLIVTMRGTQLAPQVITWSMPPFALSALSQDGAITILQNIAPDHTSDNFTHQLLQAIDGIPLAVTLVATLLRDGEKSESLWRRWSRSATSILETGGDDRHGNLEISIALSVESDQMKKHPEATKLLAALSQLPRGFSVENTALEGLAKHLGIHDIQSAITTLRTVALVQEDNPAGRIQTLAPIRHYYASFTSSETPQILEAVINYYVDILSQYSTVGHSESYPLISLDVPNIHSVFQSGYMASGYSQKSDKLVSATLRLQEWSNLVGYHTQETVETALTESSRPRIQRAYLLTELGRLYHQWKDNHDGAEQCIRDAIAIFKEEHDYHGEALALGELGEVLVSLQKLDEAGRAFEASLELFHTKVGNRQGSEVNVLGPLGYFYMHKGQFLEAQSILRRVLEIHKETGNHMGHSIAASKLSYLHIQLGNRDEAEEFATEALDIGKGYLYALGEGNGRFLRGRIYLSTDRLTEARVDLEKAATIFRHHGSPSDWLHAVDYLAQVYIQLDKLTEAEKLLTEARNMKPESRMTAVILTTLGWLYVCDDCFDKAEPCLKTALDLFAEFKDELWEAKTRVHLGTLYLKGHRLEAASIALARIPDAMGMVGQDADLEVRRQWVLGDLYIAEGKLDEAETLLDSAMESAKLCNLSYQQGNIRRSMGTLQVKRGHYDLAIRLFNEALELHRKARWVSEQATDLKCRDDAYKQQAKSA